MRIQPMGYTFFRDGRVMPRHTVAAEPALKRVSSFTVLDNYDFITPRPGSNGALPRLTLYSSDGSPEITYFGPAYGKRPKTKAEAIRQSMGGELCEACKMQKEKFGFGESCLSVKTPGRDEVRFPSVQLLAAFCPDCRRLFVSGGLTEERHSEKPGLARLDTGLLGQYIDIAV